MCRNNSSERATPSVWAISNSASSRAVSDTGASCRAASRRAWATLTRRDRGSDETSFAERGEALGLVLGDQRVDQFGQTGAGEDFVQLVQGQPDPMIGYASLREVVGADPLRT